MSTRKPSIHTIRVLQTLLDEGEACGANLIQTLHMPSGTVYPILLRLEKLGLVSSYWEAETPEALSRPRRRLYRVEGAGIKFLNDAVNELGLNKGLPWGTA